MKRSLRTAALAFGALVLVGCANNDADRLRVTGDGGVTATLPPIAALELPPEVKDPDCRTDAADPLVQTRSYRPAATGSSLAPEPITTEGTDSINGIDGTVAVSPTPNAITGPNIERIRKRERLIAGVDQDTLLFGYLNGRTGEIEGLDIDVLRAIAKALFNSDDPKYLELRPVRYSERVQQLLVPYPTKEEIDKGRIDSIDIVADTFTINCRRWGWINFSSIYLSASQKVLVAKTSTAQSVGDLSGQRVCMAAGSTSIENIKNANPAVKIVEVADQTDCLLLFQRGEADAISTDDVILYGLATLDPNVKVLDQAFAPEPYGLGLRKDADDFTRFVNQVLEDMRQNGELKALYDKWLGPVLGDKIPPVPPAQYRD